MFSQRFCNHLCGFTVILFTKAGVSPPQLWETREPTDYAGKEWTCPRRATRGRVLVIHFLEQPAWNYPWHKHLLFQYTWDPCSEQQLIYYKPLTTTLFFKQLLLHLFKDIFPGTNPQSEIFWHRAGTSRSSQQPRQRGITLINWVAEQLHERFGRRLRVQNPVPDLLTASQDRGTLDIHSLGRLSRQHGQAPGLPRQVSVLQPNPADLLSTSAQKSTSLPARASQAAPGEISTKATIFFQVIWPAPQLQRGQVLESRARSEPEHVIWARASLNYKQAVWGFAVWKTREPGQSHMQNTVFSQIFLWEPNHLQISAQH